MPHPAQPGLAAAVLVADHLGDLSARRGHGPHRLTRSSERPSKPEVQATRAMRTPAQMVDHHDMMGLAMGIDATDDNPNLTGHARHRCTSPRSHWMGQRVAVGRDGQDSDGCLLAPPSREAQQPTSGNRLCHPLEPVWHLLRARELAQTTATQVHLAGLVNRVVARPSQITELLERFDTYPTLTDALAAVAD